MVGFDIINLFDQETAINKFMTQLQSGTVEFSEEDFYAGNVNFAAKAAVAGVQNPLLPAGERLPAAPHHSLQRPVLVLEPDRETGSTAGPGFLWSRVRFPGRATLRGWRGPLRTERRHGQAVVPTHERP